MGTPWEQAWMWSCLDSFASDDDVAVGVDADDEPGVDGHGGPELLDDGRARQPGTGGEVLAPVDGGVDPTAFRVEADAAPTGRDGRWVRLRGLRGELRTSDRPDAGHPEVDPLDLLVRIALEVVPVQRAVLVVEATGHRVDDVL